VLKSANEIAKLSQEAKQKQKAQEENARQSALLIQAERQNFEKTAVNAAKAGASFIVVTRIPVGALYLEKLGFLVEKLEKKPERLSFLERSSRETHIEIAGCIDRLHSETPLVQTILQDECLEPSSFLPFLDWLWRDGRVKDAKSVDALLGILKSYRGVDENWIDAKRHEFVFCLDRFFKLKYFDSGLSQLRSRTQLIPEGADSAYLVSWEGSEDGGGNVIEFSAQKLKWLSIHWTTLSTILNAKLEELAGIGETEFSCVLEFDGRVWFLDDGLNLNDETPHSTEACSPHLIETQLSGSGYHVVVQSLSFDDDYVEEFLSPLDLLSKPPQEGDLCRLTIQWL